jgi:hypothetical protein
MSTATPPENEPQTGTERFDRDPEAIAWARTKIQHSIDKADRFSREADTPAPAPEPGLREQYAAALWASAEHTIVAEWICCAPLDPKHDLCAQGYAAMRMIRALIVDDPEAYKPPPLPDAVLSVRDAELEQLREQRDASDDAARRILAQRQELAAERYAWQERGDRAEKRLRLAHEARRAKIAQLGEIKRAMLDAGLMDEADPYSHADLADVIRQTAAGDRERAARAEAAIARVHAYLISLCRGLHPSHDHLCPDDVRRSILNALDQPQEEA